VEEEFMTVPQAAAALGVSEHTIRARLRKRQMRGSKLGPIWTIARTEVARWADRGRMRAPGAGRKPAR
jgi:excisionase family DNA binding protein